MVVSLNTTRLIGLKGVWVAAPNISSKRFSLAELINSWIEISLSTTFKLNLASSYSLISKIDWRITPFEIHLSSIGVISSSPPKRDCCKQKTFKVVDSLILSSSIHKTSSKPLFLASVIAGTKGPKFPARL